MRRLMAAGAWAGVLGFFYVFGDALGHDMKRLFEDLVPLIYGGIATLVIDANLERE